MVKENIQRNEGFDAESILKEEVGVNISKLPEAERVVVEDIMKTMDVVRDSYTNQLDSVDLSESGNREALIANLTFVLTNMKEFDAAPYIVEEFASQINLLKQNIDNRGDNASKLTILKDMETFSVMFTSSVVRENIKQSLVEELKLKSPVIEEVKDKPVFEFGYFMPSLESGLRKQISSSTDSLNRAQSMRFAYAGENPQVENMNFNGDQVLLKTAIEKVFSSKRFEITPGYENILENLDKVSDREAVYIIAAYQQLNGLEVDGKFGKETLAALKKDAGVRIVNRSTGEDATVG